MGVMEMENMVLRTSNIEAAYMSGVYVIFILKAWRVSKVSTKLDSTQCKANSIYICGFPSLAFMYGCGRNLKLLSYKELII
jgi:hypothetical protein